MLHSNTYQKAYHTKNTYKCFLTGVLLKVTSSHPHVKMIPVIMSETVQDTVDIRLLIGSNTAWPIE